jgi:hypothetical protein
MVFFKTLNLIPSKNIVSKMPFYPKFLETKRFQKESIENKFLGYGSY